MDAISSVYDDKTYPYPRICAHRGWSKVLPENTLPAYGAAIALGADEIELDLYATKDGVLVSCHSYDVEAISDGKGYIHELTYEELLKYDFGVKFGEQFRGLKIVKFEELLKKFANRVIMNIHVKIWDLFWTLKFSDDKMDEIIALIKKYKCEKSVYFMACPAVFLQQVKSRCPEIACAVGHYNERMWESVERAVEAGVEKMQQFEDYVNQEVIDRAHANGIKVNVFLNKSDTAENAKRFLDMGADCILTDNFIEIKNAFEDWKKSKSSKENI